MDPSTFTSRILSITEVVHNVTKSLNGLRVKYPEVESKIIEICSESSVVSVSLAQLQYYFWKCSSTETMGDRPDLLYACDTALTGCTLLYSCLENEVSNLKMAVQESPKGRVLWKHKAKKAWKHNLMDYFIKQIRGHETSLSLLLQTMQL